MMDLLHNPIADLSSRQFLAFEAIWCCVVLLGAHLLVRSGDSSDGGGWEPLPRELDPHEIAYLRGDVNELVRFLVFNLVRSGALEFVPGEKKKPGEFRQTQTSPQSGSLPAASQLVYDYFSEPHSAEALFASNVPADVAAAYADQRKALDGRMLFTTPDMRSRALNVRLVALLAIVLPSAYRFWYAATMHHRNVIFLILMTIVACVLVIPLTFVPRLSRRGKQYLRTLRAGLARPETMVVNSPAFPLIVAAGGMGVLAGTQYAPMNTTFRRQAAANGTSSSGGCGSASSGGAGGGGCGSGCGGGCGG